MHLPDYLILAAVAGLVAAAVWGMRRRRKRGKRITCGGDCTRCAVGCAARAEETQE